MIGALTTLLISDDLAHRNANYVLGIAVESKEEFEYCQWERGTMRFTHTVPRSYRQYQRYQIGRS